MAVLQCEYLELPAPAKVRAFVARPKNASAPIPAIVAFSDIFQLTAPHVRMVQRLASYGFFVVAPELYARIEPAGTVHDFDRDRQRALDDAAKMQPAWLDEDRRAVLDWMKTRREVDPDRFAACGWCFGGHLAFRAALERDIKASACFYATGVHDGNLGAARGSAGTLERTKEIRGALMLVWGTADPHIPPEGRSKIHRALEDAGVRFDVRLYDAEHAFMRDEGPRWDPRATDHAIAEVIDFFRLRV